MTFLFRIFIEYFFYLNISSNNRKMKFMWHERRFQLSITIMFSDFYVFDSGKY